MACPSVGAPWSDRTASAARAGAPLRLERLDARPLASLRVDLGFVVAVPKIFIPSSTTVVVVGVLLLRDPAAAAASGPLRLQPTTEEQHLLLDLLQHLLRGALVLPKSPLFCSPSPPCFAPQVPPLGVRWCSPSTPRRDDPRAERGRSAPAPGHPPPCEPRAATGRPDQADPVPSSPASPGRRSAPSARPANPGRDTPGRLSRAGNAPGRSPRGPRWR